MEILFKKKTNSPNLVLQKTFLNLAATTTSTAGPQAHPSNVDGGCASYISHPRALWLIILLALHIFA
jgi:hypothetical protein